MTISKAMITLPLVVVIVPQIEAQGQAQYQNSRHPNVGPIGYGEHEGQSPVLLCLLPFFTCVGRD